MAETLTNQTVGKNGPRLALAHEHVKTVFGDTPLAALVQRELNEAKTFSFLGGRDGLSARLAEQIIRLQESQFRLPDVNGSSNA